MENIWVLAQADNSDGISAVPAEEVQSVTTESTGQNTDTSQRQQPGNPLMFWIFLPFIIIMVFMLFRAPQKQKQERKKLEQSLEKNDRVLTIGGIIGTIVDLKEDEVILKVDESNNTKIKLRRSAIGKNLSKD